MLANNKGWLFACSQFRSYQVLMWFRLRILIIWLVTFFLMFQWFHFHLQIQVKCEWTLGTYACQNTCIISHWARLLYMHFCIAAWKMHKIYSKHYSNNLSSSSSFRSMRAKHCILKSLYCINHEKLHNFWLRAPPPRFI